MFELLGRLTAGEAFRLGAAAVLIAALVLSALWDRVGAGRAASPGAREESAAAAAPAGGSPEVEAPADMDPGELAAVIAAALAALGPGSRAAGLTVRPFDPQGRAAWRAAGRNAWMD